ncbi:MAG: cytochrome C oxidase subunit IV family protein [Fimbriimonadales bacterium]
MAHEQHGHLHHRSGPAAKQESTFHVHHPWIYVRTLVLLVILMIATVICAQIHFADVGPIHGTMINNLIAMAIAVSKALLVISFFMGVIYSTKLTKLWAGAGFVGFVLLFLALGDYSTRAYEPTPRWADPGSSMRRSVPEARKDAGNQQYERTGRF